MAKKLNKNLVGVLVLSTMVLMTAAGIILLTNLPGQDPTKYVEEAERLKAEGDYKVAAKTYQRAYQKDPVQNPEHLVEAAKCWIDSGDVGNARRCLNVAKVKDSRLRSALELELNLEFEIAQLWDVASQWNRVLETARRLLKIDEYRESAQVHRALGAAYLRLRGLDRSYEKKGLEALEKANALDPGNVEIIKALAGALWTAAENKRIEGLVEEADVLNKTRASLIADAASKCSGPDDAEKLVAIKLLEAQYMILEGRKKEGLALLKKLVEEEKSGTDCHLLLGRLYGGVFKRMVGIDLDEAERVLEEALEIDPKDSRLYSTLPRIYKRQIARMKDPERIREKVQEARALFKKGLEEIKRSKHFRHLRDNQARYMFFKELFLQDLDLADEAGSAAERDEKLADAESWIEQLKEEMDPGSFQVKYMTARLLYARKDLVAATKQAEAAKALLGTRRDVALERLLTALYLEQRQWGSARESLERTLQMSPRDPSLHLAMGRVLLRLDRPTEALRYLKPTAYPKVRQALSKDKTAIRLTIEAYRQLKQFEKAEIESKRLGEDTVADKLRNIDIILWEERFSEAEPKIRALLESQPENPEVIRRLLSLYQKTDRMGEARELIRTLLAKHPENRLYQRFSLIAMGDDATPEAREAAYLKFLEAEEDPFQRFRNLAGFYSSKGDLKKAMEYLDEAEKLRPDSSVVIQGQLSLALSAKDWQRAERYARRDGELNLDGTEGRIAQGRVAFRKGKAAQEAGRTEEAGKLFEQAIDLMNAGLQDYPHNSPGWTYLAATYLAAGRSNEARARLERALQVNPTNGRAHRMLARIALKQGDESTARVHLEAAVKSLADDKWVKAQLALLQEKDRPEEGIARREQQRKKDPNDSRNLVALARLYADPRVGQYDKAAEAYGEALKLTDNDVSLVREVATFYGSEDVSRPADGESLLLRLLREEKDADQKALIALILGEFYEQQKVLATADRYYRMAVSLSPSKSILANAAEFYSRTGRFDDAVEYFSRSAKLAGEGTEFARQAQSRLIAVLLAKGDLDTAKVYIDRHLEHYPSDPQGMIYEGAYHRIGGDVEKAKQAFNKHLEKDPDNAVALWQRGQLYLLLGRWESAINDLKRAKSYNPDGFEYQHRIALADALVEAGRGDEAVTELKVILNDHPEAQPVAAALVDIYSDGRLKPPRFSDAETLIYQYMREYPRDLRWPNLLGRLGERSRDWNKAIDGYRKAAEIGRNPPQVIRALFAAFRAANRPDDIIQFATEKVSPTLLNRVPEALAALAWAYSKAGRPDACFDAFDRAFAATESNLPVYTKIVADMVKAVGPEAALERAKAQAENDPENMGKQRVLVHLFQMNNRTPDAIAVCDRVEKMATRDSDLIFAHLARGMLRSTLKEYDKARAEYEAVLKLDPKQSMALNNLAFLLTEFMNNPAEALPYAKKASRLRPDDVNVLDTYGWILARNNRLGEAVGALLRALEVDRNNLDAMYHLGRVYLMKHEYEDARHRLERAKALAETQERTDDLPKITKALQELEQAGG